MAKYRKKPIVVEAVQWDGDWRGVPHGCFVTCDRTVWLSTVTDSVRMYADDWIVEGETHPVKPEVFAETYESVEDSK